MARPAVWPVTAPERISRRAACGERAASGSVLRRETISARAIGTSDGRVAGNAPHDLSTGRAGHAKFLAGMRAARDGREDLPPIPPPRVGLNVRSRDRRQVLPRAPF